MTPSFLRFPRGILENSWEEDRLLGPRSVGVSARMSSAEALLVLVGVLDGNEGMKIGGFNASQCEDNQC